MTTFIPMKLIRGKVFIFLLEQSPYLKNTKVSKTNSIKLTSDEYFIKEREMKNLGN